MSAYGWIGLEEKGKANETIYRSYYGVCVKEAGT